VNKIAGNNSERIKGDMLANYLVITIFAAYNRITQVLPVF
jgi:hypothetical protein